MRFAGTVTDALSLVSLRLVLVRARSNRTGIGPSAPSIPEVPSLSTTWAAVKMGRPSASRVPVPVPLTPLRWTTPSRLPPAATGLAKPNALMTGTVRSSRTSNVGFARAGFRLRIVPVLLPNR
jgi:hypothetical protein